ncbi:RloB family protein [Halosquirtibacter laminarini]|uniref:RloB family protein n=1 Tax=Halosquirtibacter laminarini TaxID=3374600 RepID=A0AC61NJN7_9BACT|nr:RloB family protein [Prolixibacteraceae bacterium]
MFKKTGKKPFYSITIVCCAEKKESDYFNELKKRCIRKRLKVIYENNTYGSTGGSYNQVCNTAIDIKKGLLVEYLSDALTSSSNITNKSDFNDLLHELGILVQDIDLIDYRYFEILQLTRIASFIEDFKIDDEVCIVTDVDHFESDIVNRRKDCEDAKIDVYISNPCFEVWLYYKFYDTKPSSNSIFLDSSKSKATNFKNYLANKIKGGVNTIEVANSTYINYAIDHSRKNLEYNSNNIPDIFSTNLSELCNKIIKYM